MHLGQKSSLRFSKVPGHLTGMIKISVRKGDAEKKEEEEGKLRVAKKASILNL